ncbi:MAG: gamma carbonic anhydrase family protein [Candidatus Micrarchaeota archaeon]|nr:gamma carbonic anhydrase family protein [Candidatus Micrarchaeota archaeon]
MNSIHPKSEVDSRAKLGKNVTVCAFAVIKADEGEIEIGENSSIQETCVLHGPGVRIGRNVTVGHGAIVHGARVGDNVLVGMGAILMDGAEIGDWCIIAAGSLVPPNSKIPPNSVVMGSPAKIIRETSEKDKRLIVESYENYLRKMKKRG